jgi:ligand-binding sensor domain-containing protein
LPEPFDHNAQSILRYGGALWISTLEDGLVARTTKSWKHVDVPQLSSSAPRQLVSFGGALYVRHGSGQVDRFNGKRWTRNVFSFVPRHKTLCIAQGGGKLYLGQWGGWSEWDGRAWTHHFAIPELRGVPLMALLPANGALWIGTQSKGLLRLSFATPQTLTVYDERNGLPDEWITTLAAPGSAVCAGTFVGGLARQGKNGVWQTYAALQGENVTALEPDGASGLWIGTRNGLWHWRADKVTRMNATGLDSEIQALCADGSKLWVGTRTGLFRLTQR